MDVSVNQEISEQKNKSPFTRENILTAIAVVGVGVSCLNFLILNSLSPIAAHQQLTDARVLAVEDRQDRQGTTIQQLATKSDMQSGFSAINLRIDDLKDTIKQLIQPIR